MASKRKTTLIRIKKSFKDEIGMRFPEHPIGTVLEISYRTSLVGVEAMLRGKRRKR